LNAFNQAVLKKAKIICITSGGELDNLGNKNNCKVVKIPNGFPPRTCLGYSLVQILKIFEIYNCIPTGTEGEVLTSARLLENKKEELKIEGKRIAEFFTKGFPIIYASDLYAGVIERWKQQINENSKMLCHFHVLPEMNHNEMVGWTEAGKNTAVLFIQGIDDDKRNKKRIEICIDVIKKYTPNIMSIEIKGDSKLDRIFYAIYLGDWVSLSLSEMNKVDPIEIRVIELLKSRLAE
jgi:glucose/mannose-6-phosphate isomerase